jgi:hypothetical protein
MLKHFHQVFSDLRRPGEVEVSMNSEASKADGWNR